MAQTQTEGSDYFGFQPSLEASYVFIALFGILTIAHLFFTVRVRKHWWSLVTCVGGAVEAAGWAGRLGGHFDRTSLSWYLLQQVCLALAPVFFSASCYMMFGLLIRRFGPECARLKPSRYSLLFLSVDIVCLILQAVGGALAGIAAGDHTDASTGQWIYFSGISFQLLNLCAFSYLVLEYFWRRRQAGLRYNGPRTPTQLLVTGLIAADALIIGRSVYRDFELAEGFSGTLATVQAYFICLDGAPMVACMVALLWSHAAFTFSKMPETDPQRSIEDMKLTSLPNDYPALSSELSTPFSSPGR